MNRSRKWNLGFWRATSSHNGEAGFSLLLCALGFDLTGPIKWDLEGTQNFLHFLEFAYCLLLLWTILISTLFGYSAILFMFLELLCGNCGIFEIEIEVDANRFILRSGIFFNFVHWFLRVFVTFQERINEFWKYFRECMKNANFLQNF